MKKFNLTYIYKTLFICCFGLLFANCEVEDGEIGPAGQDATNGINGTDGTDGTNGIDGLGFDELTQFGSMNLTIEGTRPDDVTFSISDTFRFTPLSPETLPFSNSMFVEETSTIFNLGRFLSAPGGEDFQSVGSTINFEVTNIDTTPEFSLLFFTIFQYPVIFDDLTVFNLTAEIEGDDAINFNITNFNFNSETNELTFSFSFDIPGTVNTTGNELSVSGEVDFIVLRSLIPIDEL